MSYPAPGGKFERVIEYPTPRIEDLIVYEIKDRDAVKNDPAKAGIAYGDAHPDTTRFPGFRLAHIQPDDPKGKNKWWYVADRDQQDSYNLETQYPYNGDPDYPRYIRTYVTRRAVYAPHVQLAVEPTDPSAYLVDQKQVKIGDPRLDSLYVAHQVVFDRLPGPKLCSAQEDPVFCEVTVCQQRDRLSELVRPAQGEDEDGMTVLDSELKDLGGGLGELVVKLAEMPSPKRYSTQDDPVFCEITTYRQQDKIENITRPDEGEEDEGLTVIDSEVRELGCGIGELIVRLSEIPSPWRVAYSTDDETNEIVAVKSRVILTDTSDPPAAPDPGESIDQRPVGCALSNLIISTIEKPEDRTEFRMIDFPFPALLASLSLNAYSDLAGNEDFSVWPNIRAAFTQRVKARLEISYHETEPSPDPSPYQLLPNRVTYRGVLFGVEAGTVLHNAISLVATTSSSNPRWGVTVETFAMDASSPTYSQYVSDIGDEKMVDEQIVKWKNNLWRRTRMYVEMR